MLTATGVPAGTTYSPSRHGTRHAPPDDRDHRPRAHPLVDRRLDVAPRALRRPDRAPPRAGARRRRACAAAAPTSTPASWRSSRARRAPASAARRAAPGRSAARRPRRARAAAARGRRVRSARSRGGRGARDHRVEVAVEQPRSAPSQEPHAARRGRRSAARPSCAIRQRRGRSELLDRRRAAALGGARARAGPRPRRSRA